jgi:hypothetical protein
MEEGMKRPSPSIVVSLIALVFSMSGGALAAKRYLITSTDQIAPKVLARLRTTTYVRGEAGPAGATGTAGATGLPGAAGATGPAGGEGARGLTGGLGDEGPRGAVGPEGKEGAQGQTGKEGPAGAPAVGGTVEAESTSEVLGYGGGTADVEVACPEGTLPVGGGFHGSTAAIMAYSSRRTATGWEVGAINVSAGNPGTMTAYAICSG